MKAIPMLLRSPRARIHAPLQRIAACTLAAVLPWLALNVSAQTQKMRPGLWEHSATMKSQSGQMEAAMAQMKEAMAQMTPQQRKQMEQMMAQQGVALGSGPGGTGSAGGNTHSVKVCITPEQAEMDRMPAREGCTQSVQRTGPSTLSMRFSCKGGQGEPASSGEGTMTFSGPTAYTGQFRLNTTTAQGKPEQIDMAQSGRWLAADCGSIKPMPGR